MKTSLSVLVAVSLLALALLGWTFTPARLGPVPELTGELPAASPPDGMSLSALPTGAIQSRAALAYRGGGFTDERDFAMTPVLVQHPRGNLLFDAGFGRDVDEHAELIPALLQSPYTKGAPAADQLAAAGFELAQLAGVVLTHAHWDHVSGLDSLPGVPVWVPTAEHDFILADSAHAALAHSLGDVDYRTYGFEDGAYLGFPRSRDVWGDGSVVLVPSPGHTPGSVIAFIALPSGARYALLGDLVWQSEGVTLPAERPWLARMVLGEDSAAVREGILRVAAITARFPEIGMLPAHDARAMGELPVWPAVVR